MTGKTPFRLPSLKLIGIAAVAGLLAGAAAVYMKEAGYGNGDDQVAGNCPASASVKEKIAPLLKGDVAAMTAVDNPRPLTSIAFKSADGQQTSLQGFAGKTLLVNLWATWCVPCREEMPALNALQRDLGSDRFTVVPINIDTGDDEKPKAFLSEIGVDHLPLYRDATMGVFNTLKKEGLAFGLPVTLLVDGKGCLIGAMNGPASWDSADGKALISAASAADL
ncbi:thiol:disulfide interchange protein TlpA [Oryzifoliimicrobium ureilyticus]|uniref:thiol:disulfide interchange protein TlpA n=1 Tax=Oryzifoliimicrobium ureilyticus TaxID=3113724 RepID=UPI0030760C7F